ncbi:MAG: class I SAM-dependent methyltransferase [Hamadaea sp.]|uniref:class I SAM-dependent methyltransferase n=1 Tax=Hamadaea sp. TaxID=2024425 RepID=UPI0017F0F716|nr:methyltransferase domain-containing protein [Hamadaea sp.]NUT21260.1 class I SAM-dependent methyltransferase [Hamadaea sp.]
MITPGLSFGSAARLYDTIRPTYPPSAITWALGGKPVRVLDLGAGTGLLGAVLLAAGHEVTAVEPDEQMRAVAAARLTTASPDRAADVLAGSAEDIPLPDGSVDAVVVGQAYHWFTPERALPEIGRVLRAGGVFAPMWNIRDERTPWVSAFSAVVGNEGWGLDQGWPYAPVTPWFTEPELGIFEHTVPIPPAALVDLARSRSYYLTADAGEQARLERDLAALAGTHPDLAGRDVVDMPYRTCVYRMRPA